MNARLVSLGNEIYLKTHNVCEWFHLNKGKLKAEKFVPLLTEEKKAQRVVWCQWWNDKIIEHGDALPVCWVDEKWFYMTSGRSKTKELPCADFENEREVFIPASAVRSRRFCTKVMLMGVVTFPNEQYGGDGKISCIESAKGSRD